MRKPEPFQNRALAHLLRAGGVPADYEQRRGSRQIDVVAEVDGLEVFLEAETGFERKAQAIKDADARLRQKLAVVAFAVCYPVGVTEDNLAGATLTWTLRTKPGEPSSEWSTGSVAQLAQSVQQAPHSLSGTDVAAQYALRRSGSGGIRSSSRPYGGRWRGTLTCRRQGPKSRQPSDRYFVAAKRGMLVVATAMLFHHRVQEHLPVLCPPSYDGPWPPASASQCAESGAPISAFREAWQGILAVDYRPVFETGRVALGTLSADPDTGQAVEQTSRSGGKGLGTSRRFAPRPAGTHLSPRAGYRSLRRLVLHVDRRRRAAGLAGSTQAGCRLVQRRCHRPPAHLRSGLRNRNLAHGRCRAHP